MNTSEHNYNLNFKSLLSATRPKTLMASVGPVVLGLSLAYVASKNVDILTALVTLTCSILLQISSNLINDYYDGIRGIDNLSRIGPERLSNKSYQSAKAIKKFAILTLFLAFVFGLYLMYAGGLPIVIIGLSSLLFAYLYTGGPLPLSYMALGEFLAFLFFGPVAVWGTYYLQTKDLNYINFSTIAIYGALPGFISAAIMSINNLRDFDSDSKTKKKTIALFLGKSRSRLLTFCLVLLPNILVVLLVLNDTQRVITFIGLVPFFIFLKTWKSILKDKVDQKFNLHLANTGKYLFLFCLFYSVGLLL